MPTPLNVQLKEPISFVIFGATGDLARRKLIPALYALFREGSLDPNFTIIGFARREHDDPSFRQLMAEALLKHSRIEPSEESVAAFMQHVSYHQGDLSDAAAYARLAARFREDGLPPNRLFYLSITPDLIEKVITLLAGNGLVTPPTSSPWTRVVVEKPFGHDLASAKDLNRTLLKVLDEQQIYRIDHYLGKETVQNILSFRFANTLFEPVFNRSSVDHIQITAAETVGMESGRGAFYDRTGALRDMVANHLFQLLCLVAMEPPDGLSAQSIQNEKIKVLRSLRPQALRDGTPPICFGQYGAGEGIPAFREEERVAPDSTTETFVALRMEVNNWRWAGVPFCLRTGKHLARKTTEIAIQFKTPPLSLFQHVACKGDVCDLTGMKPNTLIFRIQPDEGIFLQVSAKRPSMQMVVESVSMDFSYSGRWNKALPEAYERLLLDALRGDSTLFTRSDEIEAEWAAIEAVLAAAGKTREPHLYAPGSWGPAAADRLIPSPSQWRNE